LATLTTSFENQKLEVLELREKLKQSEATSMRVNDELASCKEQLQKTEGNMAKVEYEKRKLAGEMQCTRASLHGREERMGKLEVQVVMSKRTQENATDDADFYRNTVQKQITLLEDAEARHKDAEARCAKLASTIESNLQEQRSSEAAISELQRSNDWLSGEVQHKQAKINERDSAITKLSEENRHNKARVKDNEAEITELRANVMQLMHELKYENGQ